MKRSEKQITDKKLSWEPIQLIFIGSLSDVVMVGNGKLSTDDGDPGEPRKPPPTG